MIINGGLTNGDIENVKPLYNAINWRTWRVINFFLTALSLLLFISSFFTSGVADYRYIYMAMFVYSTIVSILFAVLYKKQITKALNFLMYLNGSTVYAFGIFLGVYSANDELTIAFMVMLVVFPLVILDRPHRLIILNVLASAIYITFVLLIKNERVHQMEIFNTLVYGILGCVLSTYITSSRFHGLLEEYHVKAQIYIDALTGLENEYSYLKTVEEINAAIKADKCEPFAVVVMDVNNVKSTNDTYGHIYGCAKIVEAGHYIKQLFGNSKTFHIGGDEYVAILRGADYEYAETLLERFDKKMEDFTITKDDIELRIVVARGISPYERGKDKQFKRVLSRADKLMYENKKYVKELYNLPQR